MSDLHDDAPPESVKTRLRREAGRVEAGCAAKLERSDGSVVVGTLADISSTGLFVTTDMRFVVGERLTASFRLPGTRDALTATIEVRALRDGSPLEAESRGIGGMFHDLDDGVRAAIEAFVEG